MMKTTVFLKVNSNTIDSTKDDIYTTTSIPTSTSSTSQIFKTLSTTIFVSSYDDSTMTNTHNSKRRNNINHTKHNGDSNNNIKYKNNQIVDHDINYTRLTGEHNNNNSSNNNQSMDHDDATTSSDRSKKCTTNPTIITTNHEHHNMASIETSIESNCSKPNDCTTRTIAPDPVATTSSITCPIKSIRYFDDDNDNNSYYKQQQQRGDKDEINKHERKNEQVEYDEQTVKSISAKDLRFAVNVSGCIVLLLLAISFVLIGIILSIRKHENNNNTSSSSIEGQQTPTYFDTDNDTTTTTGTDNNNNNKTLTTRSNSSTSSTSIPTVPSLSSSSLCTSSVYTTLLSRPSNVGGENGKKGIGMTLREPGKNGSYIENIPRIQQLNVYWNYAWNMNRIYQQPTPLPMYIPMFFGMPQTTHKNHTTVQKQQHLQQKLNDSYIYEHIKAGTVKYFLGYNEPDRVGQANMDVTTAIELWPILESLNIPLISPSPANINGDWMNEFMSLAKEKCYRIDYLGVHWYGSTNFQSFVNDITTIYNKYQIPIVLTEFAPADWKAFREHQEGGEENNSSTTTTIAISSSHTPSKVLQFMKQALPWLERTEWIAGYAWFSFHYTSIHGWASALFDETNIINPLGQYYQSVTNNNPYGNQSIEIG